MIFPVIHFFEGNIKGTLKLFYDKDNNHDLINYQH